MATYAMPRGCAHKIKYRSKKIALGARDKVRRRTGDQAIGVYHCLEHHCWHLGHPPGTRRETR